jgi:hypothetical protein
MARLLNANASFGLFLIRKLLAREGTGRGHSYCPRTRHEEDTFCRTARLWQAADGKPVATLSGHTGLVTVVA